MGSIGKRHYHLLQEAGEEVVGIDKPSVNPETMYMPSWEGLDMVWICTPTNIHYKYAEQAILSGVKNIFIEKPITQNLTQFEIINNLSGKRVDGYQPKIWSACNYRFHPAVKVLKANLDKVGKILYSRMHYSHYLPYQRENWQEYMKDTNITMDAGWHFVYLALWLFGEKSDKPVWSCFSDRELGINDLYTIWIEHKTKILTQINLDYLRRDKSWGIDVVGTEGTLQLRCNMKNPEAVQLILYAPLEAKMLFEGLVYSDEMYRNQLNYLLKENWNSNLNEAMDVMKICS